MVTDNVKITLESGVHARPASEFVKVANQYPCSIEVKKGDTQINGKSIMGLMMLALTEGSKIDIIVDGEQENEALKSLISLVENNFEFAQV